MVCCCLICARSGLDSFLKRDICIILCISSLIVLLPLALLEDENGYHCCVGSPGIELPLSSFLWTDLLEAANAVRTG